MKAVICVEHDANPEKIDPKYRASLIPVRRKGPTGEWKIEWRWPVGLEIEGPHALKLASYGYAKPSDEECANACGLSEEEHRINAEDAQMAILGIHSKADQELFRMGVITGYKKNAAGEMKYVWGPNAEAYKAALQEVKKDEESDDE